MPRSGRVRASCSASSRAAEPAGQKSDGFFLSPGQADGFFLSSGQADGGFLSPGQLSDGGFLSPGQASALASWGDIAATATARLHPLSNVSALFLMVRLLWRGVQPEPFRRPAQACPRYMNIR